MQETDSYDCCSLERRNLYILAGPAEISTERGAIYFFRNILFQYKCIHRTKVLEGIRKKC